jgi:predicted aspartyl protease
MTIVTYPNSRPYSGNRPYADVVLRNGSVKSPTHKCLVDTGADYLQLPSGAATAIGLGAVLNTAVPTPVRTASGSGSATMVLAKGLTVEVEGYLVTVDILFNPLNIGPAVLGRQALLAAVEAGFNASEWLWT